MPDDINTVGISTNAEAAVVPAGEPVPIEHLASKVARRREVLAQLPAQIERLERLGKADEAEILRGNMAGLQESGQQMEAELVERYGALKASIDAAMRPQEG